MLYVKIPDSWYTKPAEFGTYVDTHTYIMSVSLTVDVAGIAGALQGASTGWEIE